MEAESTTTTESVKIARFSSGKYSPAREVSTDPDRSSRTQPRTSIRRSLPKYVPSSDVMRMLSRMTRTRLLSSICSASRYCNARSLQTLTCPPSRRNWIKCTLPRSSRTSVPRMFLTLSSLADFSSIVPGFPCAWTGSTCTTNSTTPTSRHFTTFSAGPVLRRCDRCALPRVRRPVCRSFWQKADRGGTVRIPFFMRSNGIFSARSRLTGNAENAIVLERLV